MKKCMVMYASSTGNTEQMAMAIAEQARKEGAEVVLCTASTLPAAELPTITHLALGCSAHGVEELDEAEFMPALEQIEPYLRGKPVLLFGSYGWGAGGYMKPWEERTRLIGGILCGEGFVFEGAPAEAAVEEGRQRAKKLLAQ